MNVVQSTPREAIPAIEEPDFVTADDRWAADDEVIVLDPADLPGAATDEPARAYPVRVLNHHEMANDRVAGLPVLVTWCLICGSAVVYSRTVEGREFAFGQSGKLADDNMVMFDRETESEWKQTTGECLDGPLEGAHLSALPATVVPYERFRADHPEGRVLVPPGGESETSGGASTEPAEIDYTEQFREYLDGDAFGRYAIYDSLGREPTTHYDPDAGEWTPVREGHYANPRKWHRDGLDPKDVVLGVVTEGEALAFPHVRVESAGGVARATVGDRGVVVFATSDGMAAFDDPGYSFEPVSGSGSGSTGQFSADGTIWDGLTGAGEDGRALDPVPTRRTFAFAWLDDHGDASLWESASTR